MVTLWVFAFSIFFVYVHFCRSSGFKGRRRGFQFPPIGLPASTAWAWICRRSYFQMSMFRCTIFAARISKRHSRRPLSIAWTYRFCRSHCQCLQSVFPTFAILVCNVRCSYSDSRRSYFKTVFLSILVLRKLKKESFKMNQAGVGKTKGASNISQF